MRLPEDLKNFQAPDRDWGMILWRACDAAVCIVLLLWVIINFLAMESGI